MYCFNSDIQTVERLFNLYNEEEWMTQEYIRVIRLII